MPLVQATVRLVQAPNRVVQAAVRHVQAPDHDVQAAVRHVQATEFYPRNVGRVAQSPAIAAQ